MSGRDRVVTRGREFRDCTVDATGKSFEKCTFLRVHIDNMSRAESFKGCEFSWCTGDLWDRGLITRHGHIDYEVVGAPTTNGKKVRE